jgi:hypothetical protein
VTATFNGAVDTAAQALASVVVGVPPTDQTFDAMGNEATYFRALHLRAMWPSRNTARTGPRQSHDCSLRCGARYPRTSRPGHGKARKKIK